MDYGHWIIEENINLSDIPFGFIYEITNTITNRKYIGKKQCVSRVRRKPLKGKKRSRIDFKDSDWRYYTSSSNELNNDIEKYGKENFIFKIIRPCDSKWELAYYEAELQFKKNVLLKEEYYNGIINLRIGRPPQKHLRLL